MSWLADAGFDSIKITAGNGVDEDRERIEAVADALQLGRTAGELGSEWFEEPIPHTDI